jgi:hypothetical protein
MRADEATVAKQEPHYQVIHSQQGESANQAAAPGIVVPDDGALHGAGERK